MQAEKVGSATEVDPTTHALNMAFDLRNVIKGIHWHHGNQMLEMLEWICGTDRTFDKARAKMLKLINDEERAMMAAINNQIKEPALAKAKETK
jgi:hypothetical protein